MEYFSQFKWPVPFAFADALGRCQFGEGDILYPNKKARQEKWDVQPIGFCFQVLYPERQMSPPREDVSNIFQRNWGTEVRLQKYTLESPKSENFAKEGDFISTTQGRLYTALWKGDFSFLESGTEEPTMPTINTREAVKFVEIAPRIVENGKIVQERETITEIEKTEKQALRKSGGKTVFVMPYDRSNGVSLEKYLKVKHILETDLSEEPVLLTAKQAGLVDWEMYLPTLHIALFITPKLSAKALHEKVKKATYVKAKDTKREAYDIRKHGKVFS